MFRRRMARGLMAAATWVVIASMQATAAPGDWVPAAEPAPLRAAITDLVQSFPGSYPAGKKFLSRLTDLEKQLSASDPAVQQSARNDMVALQREALLSNPLVAGKVLLYVSRPQFFGAHDAMGTEFQNGEFLTNDPENIYCGGLKPWRGGGAVKTVRLDQQGRVTEVSALLNVPEGIARDPDLSFDGRSLVMSLRRNKDDDYHIYRMNIDGSALTQLTFGDKLSDLEPVHMPDGRIVFSSTREPKYCHCNRHIQANLFRMEGDGANIVQLGRNMLWEGHPSLMPDGRVMYSRWEYVDRQFGPSLGLWTMNPDGTAQTLYYGNNAWAPGAILNGHVIPGAQNVVCIFGGTHDLPWGVLAIVDRRRGMDGSAPVLQLWPAQSREFLSYDPRVNFAWDPGRIDSFGIGAYNNWHVKYEDPRPLVDERTGAGAGKYFLVSRSVSINYTYGTKPENNNVRMALFLVDTFGNEVLLHDDPAGCYDAQIVESRPTPPVIPDRVDYRRTTGMFYVENVYLGGGDEMKGVAPGTIKYLRIVEGTQKRAWPNEGYGIDAAQPPAMNWNCTIGKRIIGDVPVEADGSAYFEAPADRFVFFQALDGNKMMVQSMRSGTMVRPGEVAGCAGCHEDRLSSPTVPRMPAAMRRAPSRAEPWYGPERDFNYLTEVQPVFDRNCVSCHDYGKPAGEKLNLCGDLDAVFNKSYRELHGKSAVRWAPDAPGAPKLLIKAVHDGPPGVLPAYAWGSHRSRLVDVIRADHKDIKLSREDFERIVTWIDINAGYYGAYTAVYRDNKYARSPLTYQQYGELGPLVGDCFPPNESPAMPVNFTRPELSECLAPLKATEPNGEKYKKALAIIEAGKAQLVKQPREDMLGPKAVAVAPEDVERHERYLRQARAEESARKAIMAGTRVYPFKE